MLGRLTKQSPTAHRVRPSLPFSVPLISVPQLASPCRFTKSERGAARQSRGVCFFCFAEELLRKLAAGVPAYD
jgi:hypothetical protein